MLNFNYKTVSRGGDRLLSQNEPKWPTCKNKIQLEFQKRNSLMRFGIFNSDETNVS